MNFPDEIVDSYMDELIKEHKSQNRSQIQYKPNVKSNVSVLKKMVNDVDWNKIVPLLRKWGKIGLGAGKILYLPIRAIVDVSVMIWLLANGLSMLIHFMRGVI